MSFDFRVSDSISVQIYKLPPPENNRWSDLQSGASTFQIYQRDQKYFADPTKTVHLRQIHYILFNMQQKNEQIEKPSIAHKKLTKYFKRPLYITKAVPYLVDLVQDQVDPVTKGHVLSISLL